MFTLALIAGTYCLCAETLAQRARFGNFSGAQGTGTLSAPPANLPVIPTATQNGSIITTPPATIQQPNFSPPTISPGQPAPTLAPPPVDPFATQTQTFPTFPSTQQPLGAPPNIILPPNPGTPVYGQPGAQLQGVQPTYQGTGTNGLPAVNWPQEPWSSFSDEFIPRLFAHPRARHTYLAGTGRDQQMLINDLELASTINWPRFLGGPQPLKISPGFIFHWWGGPNSDDNPGFDMPARAYSIYVSADHITDPQKVSGFESNLTAGYYSDWNNTSSQGFRLTGKLLGWYRSNAYTVSKFGVEYLDRVNIKILPAFGVYMTPNSDMKFDIYFPKTKLAHRIPNIGRAEAWAYAGGEYGGGSWVIRRADGTGDQSDINDVRAYMGVEWRGPRCVTGFFELGYVFEREIVYRSNALNKLELQDTIMIRSGFSF